jgi:hypothetical protein
MAEKDPLSHRSTESAAAEANVFIDTYEPVLLRYHYPEWPALSDDEKHRLLEVPVNDGKATREEREQREASDAKLRSQSTHNVATDGLFAGLIDGLDPNTEGDDPIQALAVGDDSSDFNQGDTSLNNLLGDIPVTNVIPEPDDGEIRGSFFIGTNAFENQILRELGLRSLSGRLQNHAQIEPEIDKQRGEKAATIAVIIGFGPGPG